MIDFRLSLKFEVSFVALLKHRIYYEAIEKTDGKFGKSWQHWSTSWDVYLFRMLRIALRDELRFLKYNYEEYASYLKILEENKSYFPSIESLSPDEPSEWVVEDHEYWLNNTDQWHDEGYPKSLPIRIYVTRENLIELYALATVIWEDDPIDPGFEGFLRDLVWRSSKRNGNYASVDPSFKIVYDQLIENYGEIYPKLMKTLMLQDMMFNPLH